MSSDKETGDTPASGPKRSRNRAEEPYKVGPGKPPLESRFKKGEPSPNPKGRPPKKHKKGLLARLDPGTAEFLELDRRGTGVYDRHGNEITNGESVILSLQRRSLTDNRASETYMKVKQAAQAEEREWRRKGGAIAAEYIERYMNDFVETELAGRRLPSILPDPRDVDFDEEGNVIITGPINLQQKMVMLKVIKQRDRIFDVMNDVWASNKMDEVERKNLWLDLRRRAYRLNPGIPPRLRKSAPPRPW